MARPKIYKISLTDDQINKFKSALHSGAPLMVALSYAKISSAYYSYLLQIAAISAYAKEMEEVKEQDQLIGSGIAMSQVKYNAEEIGGEYSKMSALHQYKTPTAESSLKYKNNKSFAEFCDQVYDLLIECDMLRAEIALFHLGQIRKSSENRRINPNASQWFLERTMPDYFGKVEKNKFEGSVSSSMTIGGDDATALPPIKVEFVDPQTKESKDRVSDMEKLVREQLGEA